MAEEYECQWADHNKHLTEKLQGFFTNHHFCDVTLVCDGDKQIEVHKVILAACSLSFRKMFQPDVASPIVFLCDIASDTMESLIRFMYSGYTTIPGDRVPDFFKLAENLKVFSLLVISFIRML